MTCVRRLLIVPYGIETLFLHLYIGSRVSSFNRTLWNWNGDQGRCQTFNLAFNRTLWNWNFATDNLEKPTWSFNRTLWNWNKQRTFDHKLKRTFNRTLWNWNTFRTPGPKTMNVSFNRTLWNWNYGNTVVVLSNLRLLIVPYGIETDEVSRIYHFDLSFNRTLWNWNYICPGQPVHVVSFNRTLWNWNGYKSLYPDNILSLLIVPYGIETTYASKMGASASAFNRTLWNWNNWIVFPYLPVFSF